jgi:hypothetical protein
MDGRRRTPALSTLLLVAFSGFQSSLVSAGDAKTRLPDTAPIYLSGRLEKQFLRAVSVNLRLDDKLTPRRAELGIMELASPKGAKPARYKSRIVPILLEKAPGNNESYVVSRMPADLLNPDEVLTLRLIAASGGGDSATLAICGSDGNVCREVKLTQVSLPKAPVKLQAEKVDDRR